MTMNTVLPVMDLDTFHCESQAAMDAVTSSPSLCYHYVIATLI
ncbi:hypothetical protein [Cobetia sp. L2A1]|nr:hypothetical protein [Cobetia sp. L2A1]